jgi:hypothetical protein
VVQILAVGATLLFFPISIKTQWNNYLPCDGQIAWAEFPASLDATVLNFSSSFTIEGWVYFNQADAPVSVLSLRREDNTLIYRLGKKSGQCFYFEVSDSEGKTWQAAADEVVPTGEWMHLAGVLQKNEPGPDVLALYVNGNRRGLLHEEIELMPRVLTQKQTAVLRLAGEPEDQMFSGRLDEVRISATARYTEPTIAVLDNTFPVDAATIALWHFDEPFSASIVGDASWHRFDLGLIRNVASWVPAIDDFSASPYGTTSLLLSWQTKNEHELLGFEVQRRSALENFESIGFLPAHGEDHQLFKYAYTDMPDNDGRYYYRLKLLNAAGLYRFTPEVAIDFVASAR